MKKLIIALTLTTAMSGVALAADMAAPEYVEPAPERMNPVTGNVAIWGMYVTPSSYDHEDGDTCDDGDYSNFCEGDFGFGGDARAHYDFGNMHGLQLELLADYHRELDDDDDTDDEHASYFAAGGHWIYRPSNYALGGFAGVSGTGHLDQEESNVHGFIGGEAAVFMDNTTLFGQIGYNHVLGDDYDDAVKNLVFGRIGARYFFAPNSRLEGTLAYGVSDRAEVDHDASSDDREDLDWFQVAANYEHKFENNPFSIFTGYQGDYVKVAEADGDCCTESAWVHTFKVGVRMSFGGTLRDDDRYGARTFDFTNLRAPLSYADELD